jgi:hypothetical protein
LIHEGEKGSMEKVLEMLTEDLKGSSLYVNGRRLLPFSQASVVTRQLALSSLWGYGWGSVGFSRKKEDAHVC